MSSGDIPRSDRNFDDLAHRFKRNVYGGLKGDIRLQVLQRDLFEQITALDAGKPLRILDAGGGQGQLAIELAKKGHSVLICDISTEMLALAQEKIDAAGVADRVTTQQIAIQDLVGDVEPFDMVMCHAVLEWVAEPQVLLAALVQLTKAGGYLSLTFFNVNSIAFKNLLRTNFKKVLEEDYTGYRGSLTPTNPLVPEQVYGWLAELPLTEHCVSGIRCFHDYILDPELRNNEPESQMALELRLSRVEPYRSLARYIHVLSSVN
jgi:S-adenosylmethionine-dependent methyltransferase